jgi:outer membrane autotransporter protein
MLWGLLLFIGLVKNPLGHALPHLENRNLSASFDGTGNYTQAPTWQNSSLIPSFFGYALWSDDLFYQPVQGSVSGNPGELRFEQITAPPLPLSLTRTIRIPRGRANNKHLPQNYFHITTHIKNTHHQPIQIGWSETRIWGVNETRIASTELPEYPEIGNAVRSSHEHSDQTVGFVLPITKQLVGAGLVLLPNVAAIENALRIDNRENLFYHFVNPMERSNNIVILGIMSQEGGLHIPSNQEAVLEYYEVFANSFEEWKESTKKIIGLHYIEHSTIPESMKKAIFNSSKLFEKTIDLFHVMRLESLHLTEWDKYRFLDSFRTIHRPLNNMDFNIQAAAVDSLMMRMVLTRGARLKPKNVGSFRPHYSSDTNSTSFQTGQKVSFRTMSALKNHPRATFTNKEYEKKSILLGQNSTYQSTPAYCMMDKLAQKHESFRLSPHQSFTQQDFLNSSSYAQCQEYHKKTFIKNPGKTQEELLEKINLLSSRLPKEMHFGDGSMGSKTLWIQPYSSQDEMQGQGMFSSLKGSGYGVLIGAEYQWTESLMVGGLFALGSYQYNEYDVIVDAANRNGTQTKVHSYQPGFFGLWEIGDWDIQNVTTLTLLSSENLRKMDFIIQQYEAKSCYTNIGWNTKIKIEKCMDFPWVNNAFLIPYGAWTYNYLHQNQYTESGAGVFNLHSKAKGMHTMLTEGGFQYLQNFTLSPCMEYSPYLQLGLRYIKPLSKNFNQTASFVGSSDVFSLNGDFRTTLQGLLSIGLSVQYDPHRAIHSKKTLHASKKTKGIWGGFLGCESAYGSIAYNHQFMANFSYHF